MDNPIAIDPVTGLITIPIAVIVTCSVTWWCIKAINHHWDRKKRHEIWAEAHPEETRKQRQQRRDRYWRSISIGVPAVIVLLAVWFVYHAGPNSELGFIWMLVGFLVAIMTIGLWVSPPRTHQRQRLERSRSSNEQDDQHGRPAVQHRDDRTNQANMPHP